MEITFHDWQNTNFMTGANISYFEIAECLKEEAKKTNTPCKLHNFADIINGKLVLKVNIALSIVGPYAWLYHFIREESAEDFRIIRDARTVLWNGYLLQEGLCANMLHGQDLIMFPSNYARNFYISLFPHIKEHNSVVCYPFFVSRFPRLETIEKNSDYINIGYIGRVSKAKNFHNLLEAFIVASRDMNDTKVKLTVIGQMEKDFTKEQITNTLKKNGIKPENFVYIDDGKLIEHNKIWPCLQTFDVFVQPSTIETLSRVILEANHAGVPVIAARHGAGLELLDDKNLISVNYRQDAFDLDNVHSLGDVEPYEIAEKICNFEKLSKNNKLNEYKKHDEILLKLLEGDEILQKIQKSHPRVEKFIESIRITLNPRYNASSNTAINLAVDTLKNSDFSDIGKTVHKISEKLDYSPHCSISGLARGSSA